MEPIGYIYTDFDDKFGIPRQSGLIDLPGVIEFLPEFRQPEAFRGLEGYLLGSLILAILMACLMRCCLRPLARSAAVVMLS